MNTVHQFDSIKEDIEERLKILSTASSQVRDSQTFKSLLELALVVGNVLNGGNSSRGRAVAFKINTLEKFATTKGFDKKTTVRGDSNHVNGTFVVRSTRQTNNSLYLYSLPI